MSVRNKKYLAGWAVIVAVAVPIAFASKSLVQSEGGATVKIILVLAIAAIGMLSALPWWRSLDEMQKNAQLSGWYWGSTCGAVIGILGTLAIGGVHGELVRGALLMAGAQVVCFVLCWFGWQILHRGRAS